MRDLKHVLVFCCLILLPYVVSANVNIEGPVDKECPKCTRDIDCNDNNACTTDNCIFRRDTGYTCIHTTQVGCERCSSCLDCDDGDDCTIDDCNRGKCEHTSKPGCGDLVATRVSQATPLRGQYSRVAYNSDSSLTFAVATGFNSHIDPLNQCMSDNSAACGAPPSFETETGAEVNGVIEAGRSGEIDGRISLPLPSFGFEDNEDMLKWLDDTRLDNFVDVLDFSSLPPRVVFRQKIPAPYDPVDVATNDNLLAVVAKVSCSPSTSPGGDPTPGPESPPPCVGPEAEGRLFVYRIVEGELVPMWDQGTGVWPSHVVFSPDGHNIIVSNRGPLAAKGTVTVFVVATGGSYVDDFTLKTPLLSSFPRCLGGGGQIQDKLYICPDDWNAPKNLQAPPQDSDDDGLQKYAEPSSIAVSDDNKFAFVSLRKNNGILVINLGNADIDPWVVGIACTGWKNMLLKKNAFDASSKDNGAYLKPYPVLAMYQPEGIMVQKTDKGDYSILTANAGMPSMSRMTQVKDIKLWDKAFTIGEWEPKGLQTPGMMGDLWVFEGVGKLGEQYEKLFTAGGRSISMWQMSKSTLDDPTMGKFEQVWDSANILEKELKADEASSFNGVWKSDDNSPLTGPEPSGLAKGDLFGTPVLFVSLKGASAIAMFSLEDPYNPAFMRLLSFVGKNMDGQILNGDVGTEDLAFVPADQAPNGCPLLISTNPGDKMFYPGSGTLGVWQFSEKGKPCKPAPKEQTPPVEPF